MNFLEIRRLSQYSTTYLDQNEIAFKYINDNILHNTNTLVPRLFNKILVMLSSIKANSQPDFYNKPKEVHLVLQNQSYSGEIIKRLNTSKLRCDVFEVKIDQPPNYYRMLFIMENQQLVSFVLFTFGFTKTPTVIDVKTNLYSLLSSDVSKKYHIHKKGVDYQ